jgi:hypothetical protein
VLAAALPQHGIALVLVGLQAQPRQVFEQDGAAARRPGWNCATDSSRRWRRRARCWPRRLTP